MLENIIIAFFSLVGGGGLAGVLFWRANKRKANAEASKVELENETTVSDGWKQLCDERSEEIRILREENKEVKNTADIRIADKDRIIEEKDKKMSDLYDEITKQRDEKQKMHKKILDLSLEVERLSVMKCEVRGCMNRRPPSEAMM